MYSVSPLPSAIPEMFAQISTTGKLTWADRYGILAVLLDDTFVDEDERAALDRILHALRKGRVQVVDEISTIS